MTTVCDILDYIETIAPQSLKMDWDNVGLLCGSGKQAVNKILVALDPFEEVCREAVEIGADLIVTHHPLIFQGIQAVTDETSVGRTLLYLAKNNISAINAHTNLDCAEGGVNDTLAATLGLKEISPIAPGLLRQGTVKSQPLSKFLSVVKTALGCQGLRYVDSAKSVCKVAVGGGACASEMHLAAEAGCDTFVTADVKYNQFYEAKQLGINLIDAGHFHTENPVCQVLADKLQAQFPHIPVCLSQIHCDCTKFFF